MSRPWLAPLALVVAGVSLAMNVALIWQIRHPERWVGPVIERVTGVGVGADGVLRYQVSIPAGTLLALDIPVDERFPVRADTVLPVNTNVRVPLNTPFGAYSVNVPIRANVPVRATLPLHIRHTFRLRTRTTREIAVPVELRVR